LRGGCCTPTFDTPPPEFQRSSKQKTSLPNKNKKEEEATSAGFTDIPQKLKNKKSLKKKFQFKLNTLGKRYKN